MYMQVHASKCIVGVKTSYENSDMYTIIVLSRDLFTHTAGQKLYTVYRRYVRFSTALY